MCFANSARADRHRAEMRDHDRFGHGLPPVECRDCASYHGCPRKALRGPWRRNEGAEDDDGAFGGWCDRHETWVRAADQPIRDGFGCFAPSDTWVVPSVVAEMSATGCD